MEVLQYSKSRIGNNIIGIPIQSEEYHSSYRKFSKAFLPDLSAQYQLLPSPANHYYKIRKSRLDSAISKISRLAQSIDVIAQGIREHVRIGPKISETVKGKLSLGAKLIKLGGVEEVFKKNFNAIDGEKLLTVSQCYLSTTSGPIAGLLFVSNHRVAFCSERSIKLSSPTGKLIKLHYKVMIPLGKIKRAVESENVKKPNQKYVQLVTEDNFDFWFMGFLNHQKTLKYMQQAIHQSR